MATKKISELETMTKAEDNDVLAIVDTSEESTKKIAKKDFLSELSGTIEELQEELEEEKENDLTAPASGESIDLNDSAKAKIREPKLIGKSWQNSTTGKNKLNNEMESGTLDADGQPATSSTGVIRTKNYSEVEPNTQYTLSNDKNYACYIYEYDSSYVLVNSYTGGAYQSDHTTITTTSTTKYIKVRSISNQNDLTVKYMLNTGSTIEPYEEYTGGIASPNPDYSQKIHRTGDNVNLFGKELFDDTKWDISGTDEEFTIQAKNAGTTVENISYDLSGFSFVVTIDYSAMNGSIVLRDNDTTVTNLLSEYSASSGSVSRNISLSSHIDTLKIMVYSKDTVIKFKKAKLEKSLVPTPWSPYGCGNINEKIQNKNLIKLTQPGLIMGTNNTISSSQYSKTIVDTRSINSLVITGDFTLLGDNVIRAGGCNEYPAIGVTGTRFTNISASNNVIDTTNYNYVLLTYVVGGGQTEAKDRAIENSFLIEADIVASSYVPHAEQNIQFPLSQGQYFAEGDYLADDGVHHVRGQVELNGTEIWTLNANLSNNLKAITTILSDSITVANTDTTNRILATMLKGYSANELINNPVANGVALISNNRLYAVIDSSIYPDIASWKTFLSNNNMPIEYELAEEVIEAYTTEQATAWEQIKKIKTYKTVTHISSTDETPATMDMVYVRDLQTYLDNLNTRIEVLESEV